MKRLIVYSSLVIIFLALGIIGTIHTPVYYPSREILDTYFYRYNALYDEYESIIIEKGKITYDGKSFSLGDCKDYTFDKKENVLTTSCNKRIWIASSNNKSFTMSLENKGYTFYKNKKDTYNEEYIKYYGTTEEDYASLAANTLASIMISQAELSDYYNGGEETILFYRQQKCDTKCMYISNNVSLIDKNIHYVSRLSQEIINEIDKELFDESTPLVISISGGNVNYAKKVVIEKLDKESLKNFLD